MTCPPEWPFDPLCCDLPDGTEESLIEHWVAVSSELLWAASGRRYGLCDVTVRPCLRSCGGGFGFAPYKGSDGAWRNFATCGCRDDCSCVELCEVVLPGPVASVTEVLIDGEALDPDAYRLDIVGSQYRLLRTDGECFPSCSDVTADCDEPDSFCVTYEQGIELSELALAAHESLVCNLVRACIPGCKCDLPKNVTQVVRRGVTITYDTARTWLRSLPIVNAFLDSVNPDGLHSESTVFSPDVPRTRITPEPSVS